MSWRGPRITTVSPNMITTILTAQLSKSGPSATPTPCCGGSPKSPSATMCCGSRALSKCAANRHACSCRASAAASKKALTGLGARVRRARGAWSSSAKKVSTKPRLQSRSTAPGPERMHLLRTETRLVDEAEAAIDLGQTPADILFLSFADSDLSLVAAAAEGRPKNAMSLHLANLGLLKHPYSVDLYVEKAASHARFVLVRLLGGLDYWRYGVEELSRVARTQGFALAIVPGDALADPTLDAASTVSASDLRCIHAAFQQASVEHIKAVLAFIESFGHGRSAWTECARASALPAAGRYEATCRAVPSPKGQVLILFYRSYAIAEDTAPVLALADALAARRHGVTALFVSSLKDPDAIAIVSAALAESKPDMIINTTGFSARLDSKAGVLDEAGVPVLQAILSGASEAQWQDNPRGLGATDLAMNVVLPEIDGRLITRAIACKEEAPRRAELEFAPRFHAPLPSRVNYVADLAAAWVKLRRTPRARRKVACVLPDYPGRLGRGGYAVGLDTAKSVAAIAAALQEAGYATGNLPGSDVLMRKLEERD